MNIYRVEYNNTDNHGTSYHVCIILIKSKIYLNNCDCIKRIKKLHNWIANGNCGIVINSITKINNNYIATIDYIPKFGYLEKHL